VVSPLSTKHFSNTQISLINRLSLFLQHDKMDPKPVFINKNRREHR
jgi:hypothetical protein